MATAPMHSAAALATYSLHSLNAEQNRPGHEFSTSRASSNDIRILVVSTSFFLFLLGGLSINFLALRCARRRRLNGDSALNSSDFTAHVVCQPPAGITKRDLKNLPTGVYSGSDDPQAVTSQCPVCLLEFTDGEHIRVLPKCAHAFHVSCIDTWLLKHCSCPTCRGDIMDAMSTLNGGISKRVDIQIVISREGGALSSSIYKEEINAPTRYFG